MSHPVARSLLRQVSLECASLQLQARPDHDNNAGCYLAFDVMWCELAVAAS